MTRASILRFPTRASKKGVDHLGIQVEENGELDELRSRLENAALPVFDEGETVCCYAKSDKTWVQDPAGIARKNWNWDAMEDAQIYGDSREKATKARAVRQKRRENTGLL